MSLPTHELGTKERALRKGAIFCALELQRARARAKDRDVSGGYPNREACYLETVELASAATWLTAMAEQEARNA